MGRDLEKGIKRFLKRRVKITLGFIVAFLLSCNFVMASVLRIQTNLDTGKIEFSIDDAPWGENPYRENDFKDNIYINNIELKDSLWNNAKEISFINKNIINIKNNSSGATYGIYNNGEITDLINNGTFKVAGNSKSSVLGIKNYTFDKNIIGKIENLINNNLIEVENNAYNAFGIENIGNIAQLINDGTLRVKAEKEAIGIRNSRTEKDFTNTGKIGNLINNDLIEVESVVDEALGIDTAGDITSLINNGTLKVKAEYAYGIYQTDTTIGEDENNNPILKKGTIGNLINNGAIKVESTYDNAYGIFNTRGEITNLINNMTLKVKGSYESFGIENSHGIIENLINNGVIEVSTSYDGYNAYGIDNNGGKIINLINNGIFKVKGTEETFGIENYGTIKNLTNNGLMKIKGKFDKAWGIKNNEDITQMMNNGIFEIKGKKQTIGIGNYNESSEDEEGEIEVIKGVIENFTNNGLMRTKSNNNIARGIANYGGEISEIANNGIFKVKGNTQSVGIGNYSYTIKTYDKETDEDITVGAVGGVIENILNNGIISIGKNNNDFSSSIKNNGGEISKIENNGIFKVKGSYEVIGIENNNYTLGIEDEETGKEKILKGIIDNIENNGTINVENISYHAWGIKNTGEKISEIVNNGVLEVRGKNKIIGIEISGEGIEKLANQGVIKVLGDTYNSTFGIKNSTLTLDKQEFVNDGIVFSSGMTIEWNDKNKATNNGLLIGDSQFFDKNENSIKNGIMFSYDETNKNYKIYGIGVNSNTVINAVLLNEKDKDTPSWTATGTESITFENKKETGKIYNGITDTLAVKGISSMTDGVVNGYTNAVVFDEKGAGLTLDNSVINGGLAEKSFAIKGQKGNDSLYLLNETIINGNIYLGSGKDNLSLDNTVQLNGALIGGKGTDNLTFNSSAKSSEKNLNIYYNISGFENTTVDTKVTLFEKTLNNKGNVKNLSAELGDITITKNGELTLRIDGTKKNDDTGKITGHALYENNGLITSEGGKLLFALNGVGEGEIINLGKTELDKTMIGNNEIDYSRDITLDTTSLLHNIEKIDSSNIKVSTAKNLPYINVLNYNELNKIYQSIRSVDKVGEFNVDNDKKLTAFTKYLHDIYAGNPYAYSSELSRKTMDMMRNLADRDLHPEINKWSIYGGFTHIDGGTKESFYGRNYYGYDTGSRDIEADTKITGGYFKAEYGKADSVTTGIIFGGNNAESEIGNSKVEGDSFYFGGYAKKFINDFRFTLGAGFQHGDYKADRTAVGYEGITTTRSYSENYHDRGFDIYGDIRYSREIGDNLFFEPSFTLSYTYLDQDGAAENGTLATETDSKNFDYLSSEINLDVRKTILADKLTHSFIAGISYERLLNGYDEEYITGRVIGGTDFDILVPEKEKDNFLLNAKYELETEKGMLFDIKCSYRFEHDNNQDEWTVGAGVGYRF